MYDAVQPISGQPIYKATLQRFTHITVDVTATKTLGKQLVLFVATDESNILKLSVLPEFKEACMIEMWKLKDQSGGFDVLNMQFVKDTVSILETCFLKITYFFFCIRIIQTSFTYTLLI